MTRHTVSDDIRQTTAERDQHRCVKCGRSLYDIPCSLHHRRMRSHRFSGTDLPANLIWLCGSGVTGCHGEVHAHQTVAYEHGWLVHMYDDPAKISVDYWDGEHMLDNEGGRICA